MARGHLPLASAARNRTVRIPLAGRRSRAGRAKRNGELAPITFVAPRPDGTGGYLVETALDIHLFGRIRLLTGRVVVGVTKDPAPHSPPSAARTRPVHQERRSLPPRATRRRDAEAILREARRTLEASSRSW
jgi:hypothetical protein